jgi:hypothetical protein
VKQNDKTKVRTWTRPRIWVSSFNKRNMKEKHYKNNAKHENDQHKKRPDKWVNVTHAHKQKDDKQISKGEVMIEK